MKTLRIAGCVLGLAVVASASHAEPANEASLICSTTHTVECDGFDEECHQGQSDIINFPQFFRVDLKGRELHILDPGRRGEITEVTHVLQSDGLAAWRAVLLARSEAAARAREGQDE